MFYLFVREMLLKCTLPELRLENVRRIHERQIKIKNILKFFGLCFAEYLGNNEHLAEFGAVLISTGVSLWKERAEDH